MSLQLVKTTIYPGNEWVRAVALMPTILPIAQMVRTVSCDISCEKQGSRNENAIHLIEDDDFES